MIGKVIKIQKKNRSRKDLSYAFIEDTNGERYFFRLNGCDFDIALGMIVSFKGEKNEKGNIAVQVSMVS